METETEVDPEAEADVKVIERSTHEGRLLLARLREQEVQNIEDVVELSLAFMQTRATSGQETPMAEAVEAWLRAHGWRVFRQYVGARYNVYAIPAAVHTRHCAGGDGGGGGSMMEDGRDVKELFESPLVPCSSFGKQRDAGHAVSRESKISKDIEAAARGFPSPFFVFNSHLDTVPPYIPPSYDTHKGVLYGRGACDTNSLTAAQIIAATRIKDEREARREGKRRGMDTAQTGDGGEDDALDRYIALLYVVSEETDHSGMKAFASLAQHSHHNCLRKLRTPQPPLPCPAPPASPASLRSSPALHTHPSSFAPAYVCVGEPTRSRQATMHTGILKVTLSVQGHACHSGYPERGANANHCLLALLARVQEEDWKAGTTVNIGTCGHRGYDNA